MDLKSEEMEVLDIGECPPSGLQMILLKTSNGHSQYAVDNTEISNEKELVEGGGVMAMDTKPEEMDVLDVGECPPSRLQTEETGVLDIGEYPPSRLRTTQSTVKQRN